MAPIPRKQWLRYAISLFRLSLQFGGDVMERDKHNKYNSGCWACKYAISSDSCLRCESCGWFICIRCANCAPYCERTNRGREFLLQYKQYVEEQEKLREAEARAARIEQRRLEKERTAEAERKFRLLADAYRNSALENGVIHSTYGEGTVLSFSRDSSNEYIHIKFQTKEARFVFPKAFDDGFLSVNLVTPPTEPCSRGPV